MFTAFVIASFQAAVTPPTVTLSPERLVYLMVLLNNPKTPRFSKSGKKIGEGLNTEEWLELLSSDDDRLLLLSYRNRFNCSETRALAASILMQRQSWYFNQPGSAMIKLMHEILKDGDDKVRVAASDRLYSCGARFRQLRELDRKVNLHGSFGPGTIKALTKQIVGMVSDANSEVAANSILALSTNEMDGAGLNEVLCSLSSRNDSVRAAAIRTLGWIGVADTRSLPSILALLNDKPSMKELDSAAFALGRFGSAGKTAVADLIKILNMPKPDEVCESNMMELRHRAVISLGMIGPGASLAMNDILNYHKLEKSGSRARDTILAIERIDSAAGFKLRQSYLINDAKHTVK